MGIGIRQRVSIAAWHVYQYSIAMRQDKVERRGQGGKGARTGRTDVESVSSSHPPNAEDGHAQESILVRHHVSCICTFQLVVIPVTPREAGVVESRVG